MFLRRSSAPPWKNRERRRHLDDAFEQALTIVYRIVFLLFAEARALVPVWHPVYRDSYSLDTLRAAIERPHGALGLWDALRAIARLAHAGCRAGDLRVTPFNGRLFAPARTPLAERRNLDDDAARRAMLALSTRPSADGAGREPIAYRDLGVEQLGAVYETLLDYKPAADMSSARRRRGRPRLELRAGSGLRKATGTFYTPQPIAEYLVRRTLGPLVRDADPDRILQLRVVDPSMGSGAFLVAACRYLAAAYEAALVRTGGCAARDIGERERATIRRSVAERCLYGVDLNPMAVQLARLSVWLTTLAGDRPLSFLDHRLHVGNSLLGAWLAALARAPAGRRRRSRATDDRGPSLFDEWNVRDALREVLPVRFSMESVPNDTVEQVREKERAFAAMNARGTALRRWRRVADLWCASWLAGDRVPAQAFSALSDAILAGGGALSPQLAGQYLRAAEEISKAHRFFHWELECPEVFFAADGTRLANGGFDAVLGNPPWDMIRAGNHAARDDPGRVLRFTRDAGIYVAQSDGHANCYQLFCERAVSLTRAGGRMGLVIPAGLAMDAGSASLRRFLLARCDVDALVGFENRRGVFPIHRSIRFLLMTASVGRSTDQRHVPLRRRRPRRARGGGRRTGGHPSLVSASTSVAACRAALGRRLDDSLAADADRPRDRRAGGGAVPTARRRAGVGRQVRARAQRDRGSAPVPRSQGRSDAGLACPLSRESRSNRSWWISRRAAGPCVRAMQAAGCGMDATCGRGWPTGTWRAPRIG